jgi:hypothetical protein
MYASYEKYMQENVCAQNEALLLTNIRIHKRFWDQVDSHPAIVKEILHMSEMVAIFAKSYEKDHIQQDSLFRSKCHPETSLSWN